MSANDRQEGGRHYKEAGIQHWDAIKHWMTPDQYIGYLLGSASKYLARYNKKGGVEGAKKSIHYLEKLIEFVNESTAKEEEPSEKGGTLYPPLQYETSEQKGRLIKSTEVLDIQSPPPRPLRKEKQKFPRSNESYVYEGGTKDYDLWRCRRCKDHFKTPLEADPGEYHSHDEGNPTLTYVNLDK